MTLKSISSLTELLKAGCIFQCRL